MKKTIEYCDNKTPKNSGAGYEHTGGKRVLFKQGHMVNANDALNQMTLTQRVHNKDEGYVKGHHLIQSFSVDELDPSDEKSQMKANMMGYDLAKELYPNAQWVVYTHADGDGGQLHNHIVVNAVQPDGRSLRGDSRRWGYIAKKNDEIIARRGLTPLPESNYTEARDNRLDGSKRAKNGEYWMNKRSDKPYSWKDDLKTRVNDAYSDESVHSYEEFIEALNEREVYVKEGKRGLEYEMYPLRRGAGGTKKLTARKMDDDPKKFTEQGLIDEYENRHQEAMAELRARDAEIEERIKEYEKRQAEALRQSRIDWENQQKRKREEAAKRQAEASKYFGKRALEEAKRNIKEKEEQQKSKQRQVQPVKEDTGPEL